MGSGDLLSETRIAGSDSHSDMSRLAACALTKRTRMGTRAGEFRRSRELPVLVGSNRTRRRRAAQQAESSEREKFETTQTTEARRKFGLKPWRSRCR